MQQVGSARHEPTARVRSRNCHSRFDRRKSNESDLHRVQVFWSAEAFDGSDIAAIVHRRPLTCTVQAQRWR